MLRSVVLVALLVGATAAWADSIEDKAALCSACHGAKGLPERQVIPDHLGPERGLPLSRAPRFPEGRAQGRPHDADRADRSARRMRWRSPNISPPSPGRTPAAPAASKADAEVAIGVNKSVVCTSCHLEQFQGDSSVPRLADQEHDYLAQDHDGLPHARARQQPRHVGSDEFHHARTDRGDGGYLAGFVTAGLGRPGRKQAHSVSSSPPARPQGRGRCRPRSCRGRP